MWVVLFMRIVLVILGNNAEDLVVNFMDEADVVL